MLQNKTKELFTQALEEELKTKPLNKIRVTTLAKKVGTSTQNFYYHFQDKYELVAWIFVNDFNTVFYQENDKFSEHEILAMMEKINSHKAFYQKTLEDNSQNTIEEYIIQFNIDFSEKLTKEYLSVSSLTTDQTLQIHYHVCATVGLLKEWIFDKLDISFAELAKFQYQKMPQFLREAFTNRSNK